YYEIGNFEKARQLNEEAIETAKMEFGTDGSDIARHYSSRARLDFIRQEYEMAMIWVDRAIAIGESNSRQYYNDYGFNFYMKGNLLLNNEAFEKAIEYYDRALESFDGQPIHKDLIVASLDGKLRCLAYLKNEEQVRSVIAEIKEQLASGKVRDLVEVNALLALSFGYKALKDYDATIEYLNQVISKGSEKEQSTTLPLYLGYYQYSQVAFERGNEEKALLLIEKAIEANTRKIKDEVNFISPNSHFELLSHKARLLASENRLEEAIAILDTGFERVQSDRVSMIGFNFSMQAIYTLRNPALDICYRLYEKTKDQSYLEKALRYGELTKSQQLAEWTIESVDLKANRLDSSLFSRRKTLSNSVRTIERLITISDDEAKANTLTDSLFVERKRLYDVAEEIKQKHPDFYKAAYEKMNTRWEDVTKSLGNEEQILSYFLTEEALYFLLIDSDPVFIKIDTEGLKKDMRTFRSMLRDPSIAGLPAISRQIHDRILPVGMQKLAERLTIVTDGAIAYLPFEVLQDQDNKYLLEKHDITYSYSVKTRSNLLSTSQNDQFIALASDFDDQRLPRNSAEVLRNELNELPGAVREAESVAEIYNGKAYVNSLATEANFRKFSEEAGLIHLATHAVTEDAIPNQSRLVFESAGDTLHDGYLHAYEIYNMELNADLVTLSACNTGSGKIKRGEGVMSLSRAFAYAGVPATVVSLWPASDKSAPQLMTHFYSNLKQGQSKDVALTAAKRQYLLTAKGKAKHPFYWGGFVLIGDNSPVSREGSLWSWIIFSLLACMFLAYLLRIKKKRKKLN
ncbi:MAG: CHAT domain-containing protein, partial [Cyclobacteriaceae bacterium]